MLFGLNRQIVLSRIMACLTALLVVSSWQQTVTAQVATEDSCNTVAVPRRQLTAIQEELRYLRARDAERQAWQDSVMSRLPNINSEHRRVSYASGAGDKPLDADVFVDDQSDYSGKSCDCCCGCYPCQCPLPEAPCLDCPHVSTLSPYFNIHLFGALKLDMLFGSARAVSPGTPFFLFPGTSPGFEDNYVSLHARQSTLGAAFTGPQFHGLQSGGMVVAMFFNDSVVADQYGLLPLQAFGELRNQDWRFAAGLQFDVFSPGIPTVLPFSALSASGNVGNSFRGQLRLERFLHVSEEKQWTLQAALSEPITSTIDPAFKVLEDNGWPNIEGRIALGLGPMAGAGLAAKRPIEVGVSGVVGQIRSTVPTVRQVVADVWGLSCDFRWRINEVFGVQGEVFTGKTLGTYNGGVLQNINMVTLEGIRSSGGFGEVYVYWTPCLHSHFGFGIDDPKNQDVNVLGKLRNSTVFANLLWDLNPTFRIGFEFTWRETDYKLLPDNEGAGFQTQFQWAF
jgi:hypothetical protein